MIFIRDTILKLILLILLKFIDQVFFYSFILSGSYTPAIITIEIYKIPSCFVPEKEMKIMEVVRKSAVPEMN
jgi:hypothetical protein